MNALGEGVVVSTEKKLMAYHVGRLSDRSADVRLRSIQELRLLCDIEALPALENVYKSDTDAEVRTLALEVGREIYWKNQKKDNSG